ncbi:hypothetical protein V502_01051 [Pseudogymnoascus sp. VKM F-4520 (FW-2644)]|nr:hypothetical protein V502_01051 [Pseudogymnoascus sp. VKM F-4520 (FW-2644)]
MDPAITNELSKLEDGIAFRASPDHFHHTWARTFSSAPELYIQPQSVEEVEKVTTLARRCRRRITTVGSGHSPSDLTCTSSWMVNLDKFNKILSVDRETGLVTMQAGIRLFQLSEELDKLGLAMPNLGSINEQSIAGAISTGTHGSTLLHSILSSSVTRLRITLSNSQTVTCSPEENEDLFRAALCSLGALGVITEITFLAVPAFSLHWKQTLYPHKHVLDTWNTNLWTQGEFVRVWWYPYTRRATIWHASKTTEPALDLQHRAASFDSSFGYHVYHNLLYIAQWVPRILPWVEWFITGMQFGFSAGPQTTIEAIQPSRQALLMDCLYSQTVNEWALPLRNGPTALRRLTSWLNRLPPTDPEYVEHGIPYSAEGLWVHAPIEVRVSDTTLKLENNDGSSRKSVRPHLDTSAKDGPTLYLNATLYRPYNMDPPCLARYYQAFEYLMRELDGKPHWAKNFETTNEELNEMYGDDLKSWLNVRNEADPEGMFIGPWHREHILGEEPRFALEEAEVDRKPMRKGGVEIFGELASKTAQKERDEVGESPIALSENVSSYSSQSSFDFLNNSEAPESQQLPNSSTNGTKGKGLAEAMEQVAGNPEAAEDATKLATIATLDSSISSIEAVLHDLADSQTTRSEYTASSTPDSSFQEKSEQITSGSEEAPSVDEAALVEEFWIGAAAAKAEAAAREEAAAKETAEKAEAAAEQEAARKEQASKEQAAKEQAAKEQAAKEQAAKEQAVKEQAAKEAAAKEQAAKEQAVKEQAAKEAAAKEQAAKEAAAKEQAAKEQAAREQAAKEAAAKEQAAKEQAAKEQAAKEQAVKEQAAKEQAAKEQAAKEQAAKEAAAKEQAAKEQAAKEQAAKEQAAKEQAAKEQAAKEEATRKAEAAAKEQAAKEQAAKEQAAKEVAARKAEAAAKEQAAKEQSAKEVAARKAEAAAKEQAAKEVAAQKAEAAAKEQAAKEQAAKEQAAKEQAAKEQAAKEQAAKEQAAKEEAARKEQAAKEQAAKEEAARKEQAAKEQAAKDQAAKDQAAKEQATAKKEAAAKEEAARKEESAAKESVPAKKTATAKKPASPKKTTAAAKKTATAKESAKDAGQTVTTQQAQQHEGTKARRLSFAKVAALSTEEAPKPTEPAAPVLDLHHLPEPSPPKTNGRHFLPLQSRANGANAKSKVANKEAASPKAAKKEQQSQTTNAAGSLKQAKKEQQSATTDAAAPHSKREAFDGSASTRAVKRAKLAELAEALDHVEPAAAAKKENVPPPVARPTSLDDMLEEQAKAREGKRTTGGWRPQARPNSLDELLEEQARERKEKSTEGGWRPQLRVNS